MDNNHFQNEKLHKNWKSQTNCLCANQIEKKQKKYAIVWSIK